MRAPKLPPLTVSYPHAIFHRSPVVALGAMWLAFLVAVSASTVNAQCRQWNLSGEWRILQGKGTWITLNVNQSGTVITGKVGFERMAPKGVDLIEVGGSIDGTVVGDAFNAQIYWNNGLIGVYHGRIGHQGRLVGDTYDKNQPTSRMPWHSAEPLKCADVAPVATPKPIKKIGNAPRTPGAAIPAPAAVPSITAIPKNVSVPAGQAEGTTTLTWDGGADHPYSEVWVKVDDHDEKFLVEDGRGTRTVSVKPGKTYTYILTDSGQRLATVSVRANQ